MYGYNNPYTTNYNQNYNMTPRYQPVDIMNQQLNNQAYIQSMQNMSSQPGLLGKSVESIDVVKAMEIPLDGSTSYFPLTDGSAIITKKLQNDGTSKTVIYKPIEEEKTETIKFVTFDDLDKKIKELNNNDLDFIIEDLEMLKREIKELKSKKKGKDE